MEPNPWALGWEAMVAIGTTTLAGVTGFLAWETKRLAKSTVQEIAAAARPLLVPWYEVSAFHLKDERLQLPVKNVGGGAGDCCSRRTRSRRSTDSNNVRASVVPPDETRELFFTDSNIVAHKQVLIDYRDISGRHYSSAITLKQIRDPRDEGKHPHYIVSNAHVFSDLTLTRQREPSQPADLRSLPKDG